MNKSKPAFPKILFVRCDQALLDALDKRRGKRGTDRARGPRARSRSDVAREILWAALKVPRVVE